MGRLIVEADQDGFGSHAFCSFEKEQALRAMSLKVVGPVESVIASDAGRASWVGC